MHRLYVVDAADHPVGVLSLKDMLRHVVCKVPVTTDARGVPIETPHAASPLRAVGGTS